MGCVKIPVATPNTVKENTVEENTVKGSSLDINGFIIFIVCLTVVSLLKLNIRHKLKIAKVIFIKPCLKKFEMQGDLSEYDIM